ncbi:polysaccharide deacetylase family protein [Rheinheimera sp. F8]|uniref:polysaccharide deacetylase family protein n=1 Tax=Rheinheimera sp. F8 TaxID=1763998 RepID=UPI0007449149|nr:polysaccharide deacetylase family protein [Rheinheimera sp. F8]ALZ75125.1 polysaccharide deacetylase [Rheinheimera sp. F8]ALZ76449.1 polysaccharide deacetylase [Rheinheimera sp. F8]
MRVQSHFMFLLVLVLFSVAGIWRLSSLPDLQVFGEIKSQAIVSEKVVALTFDDGPTPDKTNQILQILAEEQIPATFFLIGQEVQQHPQLVRQILAAGHQVGNHSFSHQRMIFKSPAFVAGEIEQTDTLLRDSGVDGVIYFRPPYGKKLLILPWYLMKHHRVSVTWDVAPENFPKIAKDPQALVDYTVQQTKPGSIILLHVMYDSRQATMQAVPEIIRQLKAQGYRFVTVHELLKLEQAQH